MHFGAVSMEYLLTAIMGVLVGAVSAGLWVYHAVRKRVSVLQGQWTDESQRRITAEERNSRIPELETQLAAREQRVGELQEQCTSLKAETSRLSTKLEEQEKAVASGHWILYRYDPRRADEGLNPLQIDSKDPTIPVREYMYSENRYRILKSMDPVRAEEMALLAQRDVDRRWNLYKQMSEMDFGWAKKT